MPSLTSKYANLSIEAKRSDKMKRTFDTTKFTKRTYSTWAVETLENAMAKSLYLQKAFPHFKVIDNYDNRFIIEDSKNNKIVKVEWKDNKAICNDKDENYVIFALLHPDFRLS